MYTIAARRKVGEFKYDEDDNMEGLLSKPPIELENGVVYIGRWNS